VLQWTSDSPECFPEALPGSKSISGLNGGWFGKRKDRPMLPNMAAAKTGNGVNILTGRKSSYMITMIAAGIRMP
jgi:hypothetical protein